MKNFFVSVGLAATAAGVSAAYAQELQTASPKLWDVSATLRGFYDDNYTYGADKKGSMGWEFSPSVSAHMDRRQTDFGIRYTFGMYYYVQRANDGVDPLDYTHSGDLWLDHAFSESLKLNLRDSLIIAQDPELVNGGSVERVQGNNLNNYFRAGLVKDWTRHFSTETHYDNRVVHYSDTSDDNNSGSNPSNAALLDRVEQSVGNDFRWEFNPESMGFVGYQFTWVRYTGDQKIAPDAVIMPGGRYVQYWSSARNYNAHYTYVGMQHVFSPHLSGTGKVGATYVDMYNDPVSPSGSWAPYADLSATLTYIPGCYFQGGFRQDIASTSESAPGADYELTQYQKTSTVYLDWVHQLTPKLSTSIVSQYIYSYYESGAYSGQPENEVNVNLNLNYKISRNFWAETGYSFNELFSTVDGRGNTRNLVYLGVGASY